MVVHICNPSYLGGWGWRIASLKPSWATQQDPVSKKNMRLVNLVAFCVFGVGKYSLGKRLLLDSPTPNSGFQELRTSELHSDSLKPFCDWKLWQFGPSGVLGRCFTAPSLAFSMLMMNLNCSILQSCWAGTFSNQVILAFSLVVPSLHPPFASGIFL
jgi:hypothetical protein